MIECWVLWAPRFLYVTENCGVMFVLGKVGSVIGSDYCFKQGTAYEFLSGLVDSKMCISARSGLM